MSPNALKLASLHRIGFWTLPHYSMIALSNALEGCRMANYVTGRDVYTWSVLTLEGGSTPASNGLSLTPTRRVADAGTLDIVFVCGGVDVRHVVDAGIKNALRRLTRQGVPLGALCTGAFALAESDLLDGYRCAIHWENLAAIREEFPRVDFAEDLFVIDRDRFTCTGGVAPLDMMLTLIDARLGHEVASKVSDQFIVERMRAAGQPQSGPMRSAARSGNPVLSEAAQLMERTIAKSGIFFARLGRTPVGHKMPLMVSGAVAAGVTPVVILKSNVSTWLAAPASRMKMTFCAVFFAVGWWRFQTFDDPP